MHSNVRVKRLKRKLTGSLYTIIASSYNIISDNDIFTHVN